MFSPGNNSKLPSSFSKMIDSYFSGKPEFKRAGRQAVKRDGLTGTRRNFSWNQNGIVCSGVMEMFGGGDDY
jgi:hypothetical protein